MPRPYSERFLMQLAKADPSQPGVQLGRLLIDAEIPILYIAKGFKVTRMTVYNWMQGGDIRKPRRREVEAVVVLLTRDLESGILPAQNRTVAKSYVEDLFGTVI